MTKYADGAAPRRTDRVDRVDPSRPPEGNYMVDEPKNKMSRRKFLHGAAMGAATVGALAAAPKLDVLGLTENASDGPRELHPPRGARGRAELLPVRRRGPLRDPDRQRRGRGRGRRVSIPFQDGRPESRDLPVQHGTDLLPHRSELERASVVHRHENPGPPR